MQQEHPSINPTSKMMVVPLGVAYLAIPLGTLLVRFLDSTPEVAPFPPWALLAALGAIFAMLFRRSGVRVKKRFVFEVGMFLVLIAMLVLYRRVFIYQLAEAIRFAPEITPIIMLAFGWLWSITFGLPDRADFQRYGAILGVMCIVDLVAEVFVYQAAPTVRWIGNCDVLAGLLLIALCASLKPGNNDGGVHEPDQGSPLWRWLILAGLVACLSRTGLFAAAWIFLCFGRGTRLKRISVSLLFFLLIGATFLLPVTATDSIRYINYWLWAKSMLLLIDNPLIMVSGLPLTSALPLTVPVQMTGIWEQATGSPALMGVYLPHVPSFWLRAILGWGMIIPSALLLVLFIQLFRRMTRMGAGLVAALFAQGMSTPLLYDPSTGAIAGLAFALVLTSSAPRPNKRKKTAPTPPDTPSETNADPAIRPL